MTITLHRAARLATAASVALLLGAGPVQAGNTSNNASNNQSTNTSSDPWSSNSSSNNSSNSSSGSRRSRDHRRDERVDERDDGRVTVYRYDLFEYEEDRRGRWRSRYRERSYRERHPDNDDD